MSTPDIIITKPEAIKEKKTEKQTDKCICNSNIKKSKSENDLILNINYAQLQKLGDSFNKTL